MSKKPKLLDRPWSKFSPSSASYSPSLTFSSLDSPSPSSSVSNFSVNEMSSNDKAMEIASHSDNEDEKFLGLPFEIWMQIFRHAGMICPCIISLVTVNHRPVGSSANNRSRAPKRATSTDTVTCALHRPVSLRRPCAHTSFLPMLAVSSRARHVTRKAIFQEFLLVFTLRTTEDLMGLKQTLRGFARMPPLENSLKKIQLVLKSYDKRRIRSTGSTKSSINLYKTFCDYAGDTLQGSLKHYAFEFHVGNEIAARELVDKMTNNFRMLDSCAFRFRTSCLLEEDSILEIARSAATKAIMREEHTTQPFRFTDLPNEIKEMILKELLVNRWDPRRRQQGCISLPRYRTYNLWSMVRNPCCSGCLSYFNGGCFCISRESYSTSCTCFTSPVPIFLTSKFMYSMASYIFFTRNTFVFRLALADPLGVLSTIPQKHTQLIRHIVMIYIEPLLTIDDCARIAGLLHKKFDLRRLICDIQHVYFSQTDGSSEIMESMLSDQFDMLIAQYDESKEEREDANANKHLALP